MFRYLHSQQDMVARMLRFIDIPATSDLLLKLLNLDQEPHGLPVVDVRLVSLRRVASNLMVGRASGFVPNILQRN